MKYIPYEICVCITEFCRIVGWWKTVAGGHGREYNHHQDGPSPNGVRSRVRVLHQSNSAPEPGKGTRKQSY